MIWKSARVTNTIGRCSPAGLLHVPQWIAWCWLSKGCRRGEDRFSTPTFYKKIFTSVHFKEDEQILFLWFVADHICAQQLMKVQVILLMVSFVSTSRCLVVIPVWFHKSFILKQLIDFQGSMHFSYSPRLFVNI